MGLPFDAARLERLMGEAGVDAILASTRHNVSYLTGGYYVPFFARASRTGAGRYLSLVGLTRNQRSAFYVGRRGLSVGGEDAAMEAAGGMWIEDRRWVDQAPATSMTVAAAEEAATALRGLGLGGGTVAVEMPFLPADAFQVLRRDLPGSTLADATPLLAELRAIKRPDELETLRAVHRGTARAIEATLRAGRAEQTTRDVAEDLQRRMAAEACTYLFAFINVGPGLLRWPSASVVRGVGRPMHVDAGAALREYVSDVARMGCIGKPPELADALLGACRAAQERLRASIGPGMPCGELLRLGTELLRSTPWGEHGHFTAHGLGMVSHEPPLAVRGDPRPLQPGMVLSIETDFIHPAAGHIKLEDSVAVTSTGCAALGDVGGTWVLVD